MNQPMMIAINQTKKHYVCLFGGEAIEGANAPSQYCVDIDFR